MKKKISIWEAFRQVINNLDGRRKYTREDLVAMVIKRHSTSDWPTAKQAISGNLAEAKYIRAAQVAGILAPVDPPAKAGMKGLAWFRRVKKLPAGWSSFDLQQVAADGLRVA